MVGNFVINHLLVVFHSDSRRVLIVVIVVICTFYQLSHTKYKLYKENSISHTSFHNFFYAIPDSLMERTSLGFLVILNLTKGTEVMI